MWIALPTLFRVRARILSHRRRDFLWGRQVGDHGIQQRGDPHHPRAGRDRDGDDPTREGGRAQPAHDLFRGELSLLQILFHQLVIGLGGRFHQSRAGFGHLIGQVRRDLPLTFFGSVEMIGDAFDEVHHALHAQLAADRKGDRDGVPAQALSHFGDACERSRYALYPAW